MSSTYTSDSRRVAEFRISMNGAATMMMHWPMDVGGGSRVVPCGGGMPAQSPCTTGTRVNTDYALGGMHMRTGCSCIQKIV